MYFLFYTQAFDDKIKSFTDYRIQPTPNRTKTIRTIRELTTLLRYQHNHD